jgi:protein-disulfide isomerase
VAAGWTSYRANKKFAPPFTFQDQVDFCVSADGKSAIVGTAFVDEERAASPIAADADLGGVREFLKRILTGVRARAALDPSRDVPGFRALTISIPTGYDDWAMPAWVTAADGGTVVLGRSWRRDRSIAEQRREAIDLHDEPSEGPDGAKVTIVEYSDMQCPMCKRRSRDLPELLDKLKGELAVRRVLKTYPLTEIHPWSFRAASAAHCLFRKDPSLFFSFRSNVFARQEQLEISSLDAFVLDFAGANGALDDLKGCWLTNNDRILKDLAEGFAIGVRSTPSFVVDGVLVVWFDDQFFEEFLRKTYLGGKGMPIRKATPVATPATKAH